MPEDMPDRMPEDMPEDMSDRMPEDMPDRMPEDMSVRKCINVMVGITRSKVIFCVAICEFPGGFTLVIKDGNQESIATFDHRGAPGLSWNSGLFHGYIMGILW